jgi:retron-type reverse transcriptase
MTISLIKQVLTTPYFLHNGSFYDQSDGIAMGSPLTPIIANFYMEFSEQHSLDRAIKKPAYWYRYVNDTFVCGHMGRRKCRSFSNT